MRENIKSFCFLNLQWLLLSLVITFLDLFSKYLVMSHCILDKPVFISSFMNVYYTYNFGIAFSLFSEFGVKKSIILSFVTVFIILVLCLILCFINSSYTYFFKIAHSVVIGGALGNLVDRIRYGFVVDFIDFHIWNWHFPIFNVADLSIFIGVIMIIIYHFK